MCIELSALFYAASLEHHATIRVSYYHPNSVGIISHLEEQLEEARSESAKLKGTL